MDVKLDPVVVGERIKKYRKLRGMTQEDLFDFTGMARTYVSELELGKKEGRLSAYYNIAQALRIPLDWLTSDVSALEDDVFIQTVQNQIKDFSPQKRRLLLRLIDAVNELDDETPLT